MENLSTQHRSIIWLILSVYSIVVFMPFQGAEKKPGQNHQIISKNAELWLLLRIFFLLCLFKILIF
ncbi:hypothetical protein IQ238_26115 [Pleurocapsales cyanobacterium LEGE 06147]|nr:hypothetical protein [Pleurocapsales cyanobacterium LEGE 06147]